MAVSAAEHSQNSGDDTGANTGDTTDRIDYENVNEDRSKPLHSSFATEQGANTATTPTIVMAELNTHKTAETTRKYHGIVGDEQGGNKTLGGAQHEQETTAQQAVASNQSDAPDNEVDDGGNDIMSIVPAELPPGLTAQDEPRERGAGLAVLSSNPFAITSEGERTNRELLCFFSRATFINFSFICQDC